MMRPFLLCFALAFSLGAPACLSQESKPARVFRATAADFKLSLGHVLFSPDGFLYAAYRLPGKSRISSGLRVVAVDPATGKQIRGQDYSLPSARLPRVGSDFKLSQDGRTLVYAELHNPQVIVTIESSTLSPLSSLDSALFGAEDFAPHISAINSESLLLTAGLLGHEGRLVRVRKVRKMSLNVKDLGREISEKTVPADEDPEGAEYLSRNLSRPRDFSALLPLRSGLLGLTNRLQEGWIRAFDDAGKELAALHNPDCGFAKVSLSPDQQFGVAVCERTSLEESHFGETLRREAVVFELRTLKVISTIPMSRMSLKERGPQPSDLWVASPSPAVWHGGDRVVVAIPDFSNTVNIYFIPTSH